MHQFDSGPRSERDEGEGRAMTGNTRILVTGGNGFVGRFVCERLLQAGYDVRIASRNPSRTINAAAAAPYEISVVDEIGPHTVWDDALRGVDSVVHLAARVHIMQDISADPATEYRRVNVDGTRRLVEHAARTGARRLVFVSSIKVNGELTRAFDAQDLSLPVCDAFRETDSPNPQDPYAVSKWEAEQILQEVAANTGLEVVILRPPLVYGPQVKGNILRLMQLIRTGCPLPFRAVQNRRSLVSVWNLADALVQCLAQPQAANQTYLVSDGEDLTTEQIIRYLAEGMGRRPRLFSIPTNVGRYAMRTMGLKSTWSRLFGSLVVDSSKLHRELDWAASVLPADGLRQTGLAFAQQTST